MQPLPPLLDPQTDTEDIDLGEPFVDNWAGSEDSDCDEVRMRNFDDICIHILAATANNHKKQCIS